MLKIMLQISSDFIQLHRNKTYLRKISLILYLLVCRNLNLPLPNKQSMRHLQRIDLEASLIPFPKTLSNVLKIPYKHTNKKTSVRKKNKQPNVNDSVSSKTKSNEQTKRQSRNRRNAGQSILISGRGRKSSGSSRERRRIRGKERGRRN